MWYNIDMKYKNNLNVVYSCKYHVVWCPKYRRKVLVDKVAIRLKELVQSICIERNFDLIEMEVMPDHVHLLIEVDPQFGIHKAVKLIKGTTSRVLRQEFPWLRSRIPSLWTNSYFVSTVGGAPLSVIKQYIENQKKMYKEVAYMHTVVKTYKFKLYKKKRTSIWMTVSILPLPSGTTVLRCTGTTIVHLESIFLPIN